jgi:predicted Fe-Mo cluster-binding NifX family protein
MKHMNKIGIGVKYKGKRKKHMNKEQYFTITTTTNNKQTHIQLIKANTKKEAIKMALMNLALTDECIEDVVNIKVIVEK